MKLAFLYLAREAERKPNAKVFESLEKTIESVKRADTAVKVCLLRDSAPPDGEMGYWYMHPKMYTEMIPVAMQAQDDGFDAVVIGCVGSTDAEYAIKEVLDIPVVGIGESCLHLAQIYGQNFSIITYDNKVAAWIDRIVREQHLEDFCVSVRPAGVSPREMHERGSMSTIYRKLLREAKLAVSEDRAEVVVNASAGFVGVADYLRKHVDAPVVDAVESGIKFGEMLADLKKSKNLYQSKVACFRPSPNASQMVAKYY